MQRKEIKRDRKIKWGRVYFLSFFKLTTLARILIYEENLLENFYLYFDQIFPMNSRTAYQSLKSNFVLSCTDVNPAFFL